MTGTCARSQPERCAGAPVNPNLIAFLTHAGTDLMTLDRARPICPRTQVLGLSLLSIVSEEQMLATLNGELAKLAS